MLKTVTKRNGDIVDLDTLKITNAISKANEETQEMTIYQVEDVSMSVSQSIESQNIHVEEIQDMVEEQLMLQGYTKTAKAYILYREKQAEGRKRNLFKPRTNLKPYEYPELEKYKEAIQHSYWLFSEYNYTSDIQDYKANVKPHERTAIKNSMLAISQVEVDVKAFWGDLYKHLPKPEFANVGASFSESECYKEGTEILTPNGFVDFRDINNGDLVAQFNEDNTIDFVPAMNKIEKHYSGKLHHLTKRYMDVWITPKHNMVVYKNKDDKHFELIQSQDMNGRNSGYFLPQSAKLNGKIDTLSDLDRLRIAMQADASRASKWSNSKGVVLDRGLATNQQNYEISFKKDRKKERFIEIMKSLKDSDIVSFSKQNVSRENYVRYSIKTDRDYDYKTFDWVDLSDKSWKWAEEFIQELAEWDGCRLKGKKDGKISYSTTDKKVANIVQSVAISAGYRVTVTPYEDNRSETFNTCYKMVFVENRERVTGTYKKEEVDYNGMVYCVEVPSGAIITRYGGKMFIGGNCRHSDAYANLLELLGLNDEFEKIHEIPALINRVKYLKKHNAYASTGEQKDYMIAVLLFAAFIENVSLFSQFLIIMSFNKHKNLFSGMSNVIEATSKEESTHYLFGIDLVNTIKEENPDWFDEEMINSFKSVAQEAYDSEMELLDWIFEDGELDFLSRYTVDHFLMNRFNNAFVAIGLDPMFEVDEQEVIKTDWLDEELLTTKHVDFFSKRSVNYTKRSKAVTADDLF